MKLRKVKPYGMLYSQGREYFALTPYPIESDSWEWENDQRCVFRFVVVPRKPIGEIRDCTGIYYSHARHIVTDSFVLEYADMPEINIMELDLNLSDYELDFETNKEQ